MEVEIFVVAQGSVAEGIGLASGDKLLAYDGETVNSREQFVATVTHAAPGLHKLTIRHGEITTTHEVPAGKLGVLLANVRANPMPRPRRVLSAH